MIGAIAGAAVMFCLWKFSSINGYLYTASGITSCVVIGYLVSLLFPAPQDIEHLTIHALGNSDPKAASSSPKAASPLTAPTK